MKVIFRTVGKTQFSYIDEGCAIYEKRLKHYVPFGIEHLPDVKNAGKLASTELCKLEGKHILAKLKKEDLLILLDERGKQFSSIEFADFLQFQLQQFSTGNLIFQLGGAFGFSDEVRLRANAMLSLSKMTFSHQMIRLFFLEQLYRAMSILRNEPYHNE